MEIIDDLVINDFKSLDAFYNMFIKEKGNDNSVLSNHYNDEIKISDNDNIINDKYIIEQSSDAWKKLIAYKEFKTIGELKNYLYSLYIAHEKRIFEMAFINEKGNDMRSIPNLEYIESYFLYDKSRTNKISRYDYYYNNYNDRFGGLITLCDQLAFRYPLLFENMLINLVKLMIFGVEFGGVICVRFAMNLYRFILNSSMDKLKKEKLLSILKEKYKIPKKAFDYSEMITNEKDYYRVCCSDFNNNLINDFYNELNSMNDECKDSNFIREKCNLILSFYIKIVDTISINKFELTKLNLIFNVNEASYISSDNSNGEWLMEKLGQKLLTKNKDKKDNFYLANREFNGVIAYCYYEGFKWISYKLIKKSFDFIYTNKFYNQNIKTLNQFLMTLINFIDSVNDVDFNIIKQKYLDIL